MASGEGPDKEITLSGEGHDIIETGSSASSDYPSKVSIATGVMVSMIERSTNVYYSIQYITIRTVIYASSSSPSQSQYSM